MGFLRGLALWTGKPGFVRGPAFYGLELHEYQRHEVAERDKSWSAQGLDIDALKNVADGVNALRSPDRAFVVITHYQRLLDYIKPDVVHVLAGGRIVETGGPELALELEQHGYAWIKDRVAPEQAA